MATDEAQSGPTELTRKDLDALLQRLSEAERELFRDLVRSSDPRQALRLAELMHHLDATLVSP